MSLKRILWLVWLLLISAGAAHADPVSAIIAAAKAIFTVATLVKAALSIAINVGLSLYQKAKARKEARKNQQQSGGGVTLSIQMGESVPRSYLIGSRATSGRRAYINNWGAEDNTPNAYVTEVVEISCLPSFAGPQGVENAWFGETKGTILWNEPHPDGRGFPVLEYRLNGTDYLWLKYLDGSQTVADPFLRSRFGTHPEKPYKDTMIGRGLQIVILTARRHEERFRNGFPAGLYQPKPMRLYDLTKDSSQGGNGTHRWADPSTWEPSNILPVMIYNIARGMYYGDRWVHGGRNFSSFRFPVSSWMAAINEAKRDMGNGRQQFRGGLEVFVDRDGLDVIEDCRVGCNARMAEIGGRIKILVGAPGAAVYSFSDQEIVVTQDQNHEPFPTVAATHNTITGVYPEPAQRWTDKDAPEQTSQALLDRDGGERLPVSLRFDAVPYSEQVQSLTSTMILEEQRWRVHDLVLPPNASALEPNDVVSFSSEARGYSNKKFLIDRATAMSGRLQRMVLKEIDPSDYAPPSIIVPPVIGWIGSVPIPVQIVAGWQVAPAIIRDNTGTERRPGIEISCASRQDGVTHIRVQVALKSTGELVFDSDAIPYDRDANPSDGRLRWTLSGMFLPAESYQARGKYVSELNPNQQFSGYLDVITPNIRLGAKDVDLKTDLTTIGQDVKDLFVRFSGELVTFQERLEQVGQALILEGAMSQAERDMMRVDVGNAYAEIQNVKKVSATAEAALSQQIETISATVDGNTAAIASEITARSDADGATSTRIDGVSATFNGMFAAGLVMFQAVAAPAGVSVRFSIMLRGGSDEVFVESGFYIQIRTVGGVPVSEIAFQADKFVVTDGVSSFALFAIESGLVKMLNAKIGQAQIENLLVGESNIEAGIVRKFTSGSGTCPSVSSNTLTYGTPIAVSHGEDSPWLSIIMTGAFGNNQAPAGAVCSVYISSAQDGILGGQSLIAQTGSVALSYAFRPPAGRTSTTFRAAARSPDANASGGFVGRDCFFTISEIKAA